RCAMEIQKQMAERNADTAEGRRVELRIGINLGEIIVDEHGDIYGDGVNIAARLEALAKPGGICFSEDVYKQIKGKISIDIQDMGEQKLKNIAQPVRAFGVGLGLAPVFAPDHRPMPIIPAKPSVAVLPFINLSGDPQQEYFADGI